MHASSLLEQVRIVARVKHLSLRTETCSGYISHPPPF